MPLWTAKRKIKIIFYKRQCLPLLLSLLLLLLNPLLLAHLFEMAVSQKEKKISKVRHIDRSIL
jgi:hypothetical protein